MKNITIIMIALFLSNVNFAQSVFDKYEGHDDISTIIVNKKMFTLLSKMEAKDKETQQYINLIKKLDNLKVFVTSSEKKASDIKSTTDKYLKSSALGELIRMNESGKNVKIYAKTGATENQIKELLMFVDGGNNSEYVLMTLTGDFELNELPILIDKMKLPGGNELKKASKKR